MLISVFGIMIGRLARIRVASEGAGTVEGMKNAAIER